MEAACIVERSVLVDKIRGALWGIYVADSLSMPVHWYYNPRDITRDFGRITDYHPPKKAHPSSIMAVSNTGGHGRGGQSGRIVGDVINHGKHQYWGQKNVHYHQGMAAGENTLNAVCARLVTRSIVKSKGYNSSAFLADYVQFMTTPGSHNDTYAESFHRDFFANWAVGIKPEQCAGQEGHNTPTIGGFVMLPPGTMPMRRAATEHLALTHNSAMLASRAELYADVLSKTVKGQPLREVVDDAGKKMGLNIPALVARMSAADDTQVVGGQWSTACYITDSFPSVLYLAYKYADDFEGAVVANTNVGGENCHRGSALGALMGAAVGESRIPARYLDGLHAKEAIKNEIDAYVEAVLPNFSESPFVRMA